MAGCFKWGNPGTTTTDKCCTASGWLLNLPCRTFPNLGCAVPGVGLVIKDGGGTTVWTGTSDGSGNATVPAGTLAAGTYTLWPSLTDWYARDGTSFSFVWSDTADQTLTVAMRPNRVKWTSSDGTAWLPVISDTGGGGLGGTVTYQARAQFTVADVVGYTSNGGSPCLVDDCGSAGSGGVAFDLHFAASDSSVGTSVSEVHPVTTCGGCFIGDPLVFHFRPSHWSGSTDVGDDAHTGSIGHQAESGSLSSAGCLPKTYAFVTGGSYVGPSAANPTISLT